MLSGVASEVFKERLSGPKKGLEQKEAHGGSVILEFGKEAQDAIVL